MTIETISDDKPVLHKNSEKEVGQVQKEEEKEASPRTLQAIFDQIRITLRMCWELAGGQHRLLIYGYLTILAIEVIGTITPWFVSRLTAQVVSHEGGFQWRDAVPTLIGIYLTWTLWALTDVVRDLVSYRFRQHLSRDLPLAAAKKLLSLSRDFHQANNTGELSAKVVRGTGNVSDVLSLLLFNALPRATYIVGALLILSVTHWLFALPAIVALGANIFLMLRGRLKSRIEYDARHKLQKEVEAFTGEAVSNVLTVQANAREEEVLAEIKTKYDQMFKHRAVENGIEARSWATLGFVSNQVEWLMLMLAIYFVSKHIFSAQSFVFVVAMILRYRDELFQFGWIYDNFMEMVNGIQRLYRVLKEKVTIFDPAEPLPLPVSGCAEIVLDQVSFAYHPAEKPEEVRWALRDVSLKVGRGSVLGVAGLSGSGKSTLINLLLRLDDPTKGRVLFNGVPLNRVRLRDLRSRIGYVEQEPRLFNKTIAENIAFGHPCTQEEIEVAAKIAGAHDFIMGLDKGYQTSALDRGQRLSGGQKQRLTIARALVRKPSLLILDEPTSSVDPYSISCIMDALEKLKGTCTVVLVSHQLSTLQRLADRLIIVRDGRIVEEGTHEQLMKHNGLYAELVDIQQREDRLS